MIHGLLIACVGGWLAAQAQAGNAVPPVVTQTELAPPGAAQPKPSAPAPAAEKKSQTPKPDVSNQPPKDAVEKKSPAVAQNPPEDADKKAGGNRVAAFWIILPGK
jgi:hypothetical protein